MIRDGGDDFFIVGSESAGRSMKVSLQVASFHEKEASENQHFIKEASDFLGESALKWLSKLKECVREAILMDIDPFDGCFGMPIHWQLARWVIEKEEECGVSVFCKEAERIHDEWVEAGELREKEVLVSVPIVQEWLKAKAIPAIAQVSGIKHGASLGVISSLDLTIWEWKYLGSVKPDSVESDLEKIEQKALKATALSQVERRIKKNLPILKKDVLLFKKEIHQIRQNTWLDKVNNSF